MLIFYIHEPPMLSYMSHLHCSLPLNFAVRLIQIKYQMPILVGEGDPCRVLCLYEVDLVFYMGKSE
jgi:hypothetical protein